MLGKPKPLRSVPKLLKKDRPPKHKPSRPRRKILEEQLWKLTADYVKLRDKCCVTCGATEGLTISHWIKAGKQRIRYDIRNCNCQCSTCNNTHNYYSYYYDNYMLKKYGQSVLIELTELAIPVKWKWTVNDLEEMKIEMQDRLDSIS